MTWAYFPDEIETAAVATLAADANAGTDGVLGVKLIEVEPPQPGGGPPEVGAADMPYVGIDCSPGESEVIGTRTLTISHELQIRVLLEQNPVADAYELARKIAETCARAIRDINGSSSWIASGHQVMVDRWTTTKPEIDVENPYLVECRATVPVVVIYPEA